LLRRSRASFYFTRIARRGHHPRLRSRGQLGRSTTPREEALDPAQALSRRLGLLPQVGLQLPVLNEDPHMSQHELRDEDRWALQARRDGLQLAQKAPRVDHHGAPRPGRPVPRPRPTKAGACTRRRRRPGCQRPRARKRAEKMGDDLLSHRVSPAVPSALAGLTSLFGMGRGVSPPPSSPFLKGVFGCKARDPAWPGRRLIFGNCIALLEIPLSPRLISTTRLNTSLHLHLWPINLVVYQESYSLMGMGGLILRWASRLDAFSGYPFRT
jgi:hypothetical protein